MPSVLAEMFQKNNIEDKHTRLNKTGIVSTSISNMEYALEDSGRGLVYTIAQITRSLVHLSPVPTWEAWEKLGNTRARIQTNNSMTLGT